MSLQISKVLVTLLMILGVSTLSFSQESKEACLDRKIEEHRAAMIAQGVEDPMVKWDVIEELGEMCGIPRDLDVDGSFLSDDPIIPEDTILAYAYEMAAIIEKGSRAFCPAVAHNLRVIGEGQKHLDPGTRLRLIERHISSKSAMSCY